MKEWSLYQISTKGRILSGPQSGSWRVLNSRQTMLMLRFGSMRRRSAYPRYENFVVRRVGIRKRGAFLAAKLSSGWGVMLWGGFVRLGLFRMGRQQKALLFFWCHLPAE